MDELVTNQVKWHPVKKILFRFLFVYLFIYCFPFPVDAFKFLDPVAQPYYNLLDRLMIYVGNKWFHLSPQVAFPTFDKLDDSYYGLVFIFFNLIISSFITIIWSLADRKRTNYEKLFGWQKIYLSFFLAAFLLGYGFIKVFPSQFQAITASRLTMTMGDQSPMLLAWNFMGYSTTMMKLNGWAEVIAGLLLFFRRTTTLGAILSTAIFSFVVTMDFCFNVPVRLLASHLLFISLFLVATDGRRLLNVFILNKPAYAVKPLALVHGIGQKIFTGSLIVLAVCLIYSTVTIGLDAERDYGQSAPHGPLYGIYNTDYFIRNSDTILFSITDSVRWKQLVIDGGSWNQYGAIRFSNEKRMHCQVDADTVKKIIRIQPGADSTEKYSLAYSFPDANHLLLKGLWKKDSIEVLMAKFDLDNFKLHKEKFEWIRN